MRRIGEHVDECDLRDVESGFKDGEVAGKARSFARDIEEMGGAGGEQVAGGLRRKPVSGGIADDDVGGFGGFGESAIEIAADEPDVGIFCKDAGIVLDASAEGVGIAELFERPDRRNFCCDAECEVARSGKQIGSGEFSVWGGLGKDVADKAVQERVNDIVGLGERLGEVADAAPRDGRRQPVGRRFVFDHRCAIDRTGRDGSGQNAGFARFFCKFFDFFGNSGLRGRMNAGRSGVSRRSGFFRRIGRKRYHFECGIGVAVAAEIDLDVDLKFCAIVIDYFCIFFEPKRDGAKFWVDGDARRGRNDGMRKARKEAASGFGQVQAHAPSGGVGGNGIQRVRRKRDFGRFFDFAENGFGFKSQGGFGADEAKTATAALGGTGARIGGAPVGGSAMAFDDAGASVSRFLFEDFGKSGFARECVGDEKGFSAAKRYAFAAFDKPCDAEGDDFAPGGNRRRRRGLLWTFIFHSVSIRVQCMDEADKNMILR